jgi:hypothetical protein
MQHFICYFHFSYFVCCCLSYVSCLGSCMPNYSLPSLCVNWSERLDQDISGILATTCDHSFQCSCVSVWANSSCPVMNGCFARFALSSFALLGQHTITCGYYSFLGWCINALDLHLRWKLHHTKCLVMLIGSLFDEWWISGCLFFYRSWNYITIQT